MIDINELSINSLVSYKGKMTCRIAEIHKTWVKIDNDTGQYWDINNLDDLQPIELTFDIIQKNNFVYYDKECYWLTENVCIDCTGKVYAQHKSETYDGRWLFNSIELCQCKYVHQLQALLKLLKVDKDIQV